jgi:deoxyribonucleoside regulator
VNKQDEQGDQVQDDPERDSLVRIAHLHFIEGETQRAIAELLGVSTSTVSRSIRRAVEKGYVRFEVVAPTPQAKPAGSAEQVCQELGISSCRVAFTGRDYNATQASVAYEASHVVRGMLRDDILVGVSGGRALRALADRLRVDMQHAPPAGTRVVQLMGGVASPTSGVQAHSVAAHIATTLRGAAYLIHGPAIVASNDALTQLLGNRTISAATALFDRLDVAVVGLGSMDRSSPLLSSSFLLPEEIDALEACGAVGDVCSRFLTEKGGIADPDLNARALAIPIESLERAGHTIAIAFGVGKVDIIRAAARAGIIDTLVTDEATATALSS